LLRGRQESVFHQSAGSSSSGSAKELKDPALALDLLKEFLQSDRSIFERVDHSRLKTLPCSPGAHLLDSVEDGLLGPDPFGWRVLFLLLESNGVVNAAEHGILRPAEILRLFRKFVRWPPSTVRHSTGTMRPQWPRSLNCPFST
jgi:hypothetical protein